MTPPPIPLPLSVPAIRGFDPGGGNAADRGTNQANAAQAPTQSAQAGGHRHTLSVTGKLNIIPLWLCSAM
jgi:hypothetical protein